MHSRRPAAEANSCTRTYSLCKQAMEACTRSQGCKCADCASFAHIELPIPTTAIQNDEDAEPGQCGPALATLEARQQELTQLVAQARQQRGAGFVFSPDPVTLDADGFVPSFSPESQSRELREFWERYNFVVVCDVLSADQLVGAAAEIFQAAELGGSPPWTLEQLERINWESAYGSRYNLSKGFVGYEPPNSVCAWESRLAPALYKANALLFGRGDLLVKLDRFGMMRPTVFGGAEPRKDWQTTGEWIHWDQNPWSEPDFTRIQAVLAISEHTATRWDAGRRIPCSSSCMF